MRSEHRAKMGGSLAIVPKAASSPDDFSPEKGHTSLPDGLSDVSLGRGSLHHKYH